MSAMSAGWRVARPSLRNLEFDAAGGIGFDEIDEAPGDGAGRNFLEQDVESGAGRETAEKAADGAADADIDGLDAQDGMRASGFDDGVDLEVDIVDADDFASVECR